MVEINWTNAALEDLVDIGEYIGKDSIRYAEITVTELFESTSILENNPKAGTVVVEFEDETIRQIVRGNYRIVYKLVNAFRIDVLTVHNGARLITNTKPFKKNKPE